MKTRNMLFVGAILLSMLQPVGLSAAANENSALADQRLRTDPLVRLHDSLKAGPGR
ncbi:MAG: hypothetical protein KBI32_00250 [Phycisphaerae bacterium]|nr:hypothetical protein [Phycisphaerae bacterium]HON90521.1 hypothetical protein [Sedimentisphaerales bacterium]